MLLIIHNLPKEARYMDIKQLIQDQCGLSEAILDNLLDEGNRKRITVGLAEEEDAAIVMRKLNGLLYKNRVLYVEDVRKKKYTTQSYQTTIPSGLQPPATKDPIQYPLQTESSNMMGVNFSNMPYYMTQVSSTITNRDKPQDTRTNSNQQQFQNTPSAYQALNQWAYPMNMLCANKIQDPASLSVPQIYDSYQNDRDIPNNARSDNQTNYRDHKSPPSKRHESFGNFSQRNPRSDGIMNSEWENRRSRRDLSDGRKPSQSRVRDRSWDDRPDTESKRRSTRSNRDRGSYHEWQRDSERNTYDRSDRRRGNEFDRSECHKPQPDQNYGIWSKKPIVTATTYSSNPENSTFAKSNSNIFGTAATFGFGGQTTCNRMIFNQAQTIPVPQFATSVIAAKRPRLDQNINNIEPVNKNPKQQNTVTTNVDEQKMMLRVANWRSQSATLLAKQIIRNGSTSKINNYIFKILLKKLRECVASRLDVILGDKIVTSLDEVMASYRMKFNECNDIPFFKAVMAKVKREIGDNAVGSVPDNNINEMNPRDPRFRSANAPKPTQAAQLNVLPTQSQVTTEKFKSQRTDIQRLPKYPNSDKKQLRKLKKAEMLEYQEDFYKMEPKLQKAVDNEIEQLVQCYLNACEPSDDPDEENVRNRILTNTVGEFKKIIKLQVTKRVLNITSGLCVRIFPSPKLPKRDVLDAYLRRHGVVSLKKSDNSKMLIAYCDSYENYDKILALQTATFGDNIGIQIKPLHIAGPPAKKAKNTDTAANETEKNDSTKDIQEIDLTATDLDKSLEDIMFIENKNDVIVVHDESFDLENTTDLEEGGENTAPKDTVICDEDTSDVRGVTGVNSLSTAANHDVGDPQADRNLTTGDEGTQIEDLVPNYGDSQDGEQLTDIRHTITSVDGDSQNSIDDTVKESQNNNTDEITHAGCKDTIHEVNVERDARPHSDNNSNKQMSCEGIIDGRNQGTETIDPSKNTSDCDLMENKQVEEQASKDLDAESIDDLLNSIDEIAEDDLEDF